MASTPALTSVYDMETEAETSKPTESPPQAKRRTRANGSAAEEKSNGQKQQQQQQKKKQKIVVKEEPAEEKASETPSAKKRGAEQAAKKDTKKVKKEENAENGDIKIKEEDDQVEAFTVSDVPRLEERVECLNGIRQVPERAPRSASSADEKAKAVTDEEKAEETEKSVVYWMRRDQRVSDNWALVYAQALANEHQATLKVLFCLPQADKILGTVRRYGFMIKGLRQVETKLRLLNIPFHFALGKPEDIVIETASKHNAVAIVCDFYPLREFVGAQKAVAERAETDLEIPVYRVDAHNAVPVSVVSGKQEYAARTIRPKIHKHLNQFLVEWPQLRRQSDVKLPDPVNWPQMAQSLDIDRSVKELDWIKPGEDAAKEALKKFVDSRLKGFANNRNDPTVEVSSDLSPYLNFGQLSAARCALEANKHNRRYAKSVESYIEELVIRRELSDNFCFYQEHYDRVDCAVGWAKETLAVHKKDKRDHLYSLGELEHAVTYDDLWNASQLQLVKHGKMHGFLRMYWAKKILEWTKAPEEALATAIYLNDKYSLDGRDPNGFVGCGWSVVGVHDNAWTERPVFGKIRYMNYAGCKRKFSIPKFVAKWLGADPKSKEFKENQATARKQDETKNTRSICVPDTESGPHL